VTLCGFREPGAPKVERLLKELQNLDFRLRLLKQLAANLSRRFLLKVLSAHPFYLKSLTCRLSVFKCANR
jgi:hypothetical protein